MLKKIIFFVIIGSFSLSYTMNTTIRACVGFVQAKSNVDDIRTIARNLKIHLKITQLNNEYIILASLEDAKILRECCKKEKIAIRLPLAKYR